MTVEFNKLRVEMPTNNHALRHILTIGLVTFSTTTISSDFNVQPSWNLLGYVNPTEALNLATTFSDKTKVTTVWRWNRDTQKWGFYSPILTDGGKAYAAEKGYEYITSITSTEGFWVNAKEAFVVPPQSGATNSSPVVFEVKPSWNLLGYQNTAVPLNLTSAFSDKTKVTTVWKWIRTSQKWAFYSPILNDGGKAYSAEKGYEPMTTVGHSEGFWVNAKEAFSTKKLSSFSTIPFNDTGITFFADDTQHDLTAAPPTHPRQDANYGRDAQAAAGMLSKIGDGSKGFDFTKIANDGSALPDNATLGTSAKDWACTRDNVTGLIWEVKTTEGLRSQNHTYTYYNSNPGWGNKGAASGGTCFVSGRCDTEKYVQDVNATGLCGARDWRLPHIKELVGIVDFGRKSPAIDTTYFPNTTGSGFWSGSPHASVTDAVWSVYFSDGSAQNGYLLIYDNNRNRSDYFSVRLVRRSQ